MFDGASVAEWRLLEEHAPTMPYEEAMLRSVASDPVSQAILFDLMIKLFLHHVLGFAFCLCAKNNIHKYGPNSIQTLATTPAVLLELQLELQLEFGARETRPLELQLEFGARVTTRVWVRRKRCFGFCSLRINRKQILGVDITTGKKPAHGVASEYGRGIFGVVHAFLAPVETQGRGGLHPHIHVWTLHPMKAHLLDQLRRGLMTDELKHCLQQWRTAVIDKVASMQFESVEEIGRQSGGGCVRGCACAVPAMAAAKMLCWWW
jgi:hypothetical protein